MGKLNISLLAIITISLSACSNNNSNNSFSDSPANTSSDSSSSNSSNSNVGTINNVINGDLNGFAYKFKSTESKDNITAPISLDLTTDNKNILYVDNQRIEMAPEGLMPAYTIDYVKDNYIKLSSGTYAEGGNYLSDMQHGIYKNLSDGNTYPYVQGKFTPSENIPKTGIVNYYGFAYHINGKLDNTYQFPSGKTKTETLPSNWSIQGVSITADFDKKNIEGSILHTSSLNNITTELSASITGNTFEGEKNGTRVKGAFFGENAKEIGGIYVNTEQEYSGSFGAKNW